MKTLLIIFVILIVAIFIVFTIGFSTSSSLEKIDIASMDWRLPEPSEKGRIEKTFFLSDIDSCKNYYIKKIFNDHFIVACSVGSRWIYYNVFTNQKRIFITDEKTMADLTAPVVRREIKPIPQAKEKSSPPKRPVFIRDAR